MFPESTLQRRSFLRKEPRGQIWADIVEKMGKKTKNGMSFKVCLLSSRINWYSKSLIVEDRLKQSRYEGG